MGERDSKRYVLIFFLGVDSWGGWSGVVKKFKNFFKKFIIIFYILFWVGRALEDGDGGADII